MREIKCFIFGLGVGVAAGVLMAPRSGEKTRELIAEKAQEGQDYIAREGVELRDSVVDKLNRAKRAAHVTSEEVKMAFQDGKAELAS